MTTPKVKKFKHVQTPSLKMLSPIQAVKIATDQGWLIYNINHKLSLLQIHCKRRGCFMDIWFSRKQAVTCLNHPTQGITVMLRSSVTDADIHNLLVDPRTHTNKGFRL